MMNNISKESVEFLKEKLPEALTMNRLDALTALYTWIDYNGFAPPDYLDYNDLGREAQRVYDDIYLNG